MKNITRLFMLLWLAGCSHVDDGMDEIFNPTPDPEVHYATTHLLLHSGEEELSEETRMQLGGVDQGLATYHWNEKDRIGSILLNVQPKAVNNAITAAEIKGNIATFTYDAEFVSDTNSPAVAPGSTTPPLDLLVYYPYSASFVSPATYEAGEDSGEPCYGADYLAGGLVYRVPVLQYMLDGEYGEESSTRSMSRTAFSYAFVDCEGETGSSGGFKLHHQNTYLRFKVTGGELIDALGETRNTTDGTFLLKRITVSAGTYDAANKSLSKQVPVAGTYRLTYTYDAENFSYTDRMSCVEKGDKLQVISQLTTPQPLSADSPVYAMATLGATDLAEADALQIQVEVVEKSGGASYRVTRYVKLGDRRLQQGGFYTISFSVSGKSDPKIYLDVEEPSNAYIVPAPGLYAYNASLPGNGVLPYDTTEEELASGGVLLNQMPLGAGETYEKKYGVAWLWATGTLFNGATAEQLTAGDYFEVWLEGKEMLFRRKDDGTRSGNVVIALYEKNSDGSFKQVVWSWLMWLCDPQTYHLSFPVTRPSLGMTNENWLIHDRNIGAEFVGPLSTLDYQAAAKTVGFYYQMGRKDPFPGLKGLPDTNTYSAAYNWLDNLSGGTINNTALFGEVAQWRHSVSGTVNGVNVEIERHRYPMWLITRSFENTEADRYAWVADKAEAESNTKSLFDPCPPGYKLPTVREWDNLKDCEFEYTVPKAETSGPLGFSIWNQAVASAAAGTDTSYGTGLAWWTLGDFRRNAGEYYTTDQWNGRTWRIWSMSGTGQPILLHIPGGGALTDSGNIVSPGYSFALWSAGRVEHDIFDAVGMTGQERYDAYWFGVRTSGDYRDVDATYDACYYPYAVSTEVTSSDGTTTTTVPIPQALPVGMVGGDGNAVRKILGINASPALTVDATTYQHNGLGDGSNYAVPVRCIRQYN